MAVRLNIPMDAAVNAKLKRRIRPKRMSSFITEAVRARLTPDRPTLDAAYRAARKERWRRGLADDWRPTETEAWPD
jgi:hypothetical protein